MIELGLEFPDTHLLKKFLRSCWARLTLRGSCCICGRPKDGVYFYCRRHVYEIRSRRSQQRHYDYLLADDVESKVNEKPLTSEQAASLASKHEKLARLSRENPEEVVRRLDDFMKKP